MDISKCFVGLACLFLISLHPVVSQTWQLDRENSPGVKITGTSTLHDWTVTCSEVDGVPSSLDFDASNPESIGEFALKVAIAGMDGGRGSSMNEKIMDAFKAEENPYVEYQLSDGATVSNTSEAGTFEIKSSGTLTMAGTSAPVNVTSTGVIKDGVLTITGNHPVKMSDYDMVPPSAMFGQIKTNDDVVVSYEFQYRKQ